MRRAGGTTHSIDGVPALHGLPSGEGAGAPSIARERLEHLERENAQLREALVSRIVIEQAKGVLAERYGIEIDTAFALLRRTARSKRMRIHVLARLIVTGRAEPEKLTPASLHVASARKAGAGDGVPREVA